MTTWRGCENIEHVWNGTQSDPDLIYKGYVFNYYDIENALWDDFLSLTEYEDSDHDKPEVEHEFDLFLHDVADSYLDDCIYGGYFAKGSKSWHDSI